MAFLNGRIPAPPSFGQLFTPKLITIFREGYGTADLRADAIAGLTVAIVALPLAMAIAIASGTTPDRGLYTAIVAGFLVSAFGGSRYQIGGPTAAFVVVVYNVIDRHGYDGLALATGMAGLMLIAVGLLRIGSYIKYIPNPVITGFTAGIAVTIAAAQIKDLLGLPIERLPADFLPKMEAIWGGIGGLNPSTVVISLASLGTILLVRRYRPTWPAFLIAVGIGSILAALLPFGTETIQTQFGGVPRGLPAPSLPPISIEKAWNVLPDAVTIALLAGVESLLSAVIADTMTGRRHRSNCELVAQGIANVGSVILGGISATGALARTATNIRAGARGPVAGMLHALFLLLFMGIAAPVAGYFPLASLGAVLIVVAWGMSDAPGFVDLLRVGSNGERFVLVATFLLTVLLDITIAIQVGVVLSVFLFMHRMAETVEVEARVPLIEEDQADSAEPASRTRALDEEAEAAHVVVFRIDGPFFFGAAAKAQTLLDEIGERPKAFVLDFSAVPLIDSSGAHAIAAFVDKARSARARVYFSGVRRQVRRTLKLNGMKPPHVLYAANVPYAIDAARPGRRAIDEGIVTT